MKSFKDNLKGKDRFKVTDGFIGRGTFGVISRAIDLKDGESVAIKKVKIRRSEDIQETDPGAKSKLVVLGENHGIHFTVIRELKVMTELARYENVMGVKDVYMEEDGSQVCMVMMHMKSDLKKLFDRKMALSEPQIKCILQQCARGLRDIHKNYVLHRDLAPANVFISAKGICKLADFGLSRSFGEAKPVQRTSLVVTLWYRSPELIYGATRYEAAIDIWSLGCIFAELLNSGKPLFPGQNEIDQLAKIFSIRGTPMTEEPPAQTEEGAEGSSNGRGDVSNQIWPYHNLLPLYFQYSHAGKKNLRRLFPAATDDAIDLLDSMLSLDPSLRPTAEEILEHPFLVEAPLPCSPEELPLHML